MNPRGRVTTIDLMDISRLGTLELLVLALVVAALGWRFWPRAWRVLPRRRFTVGSLMLVVLAIGLISGGIARWQADRVRRQVLLAQAGLQQQATNAAIYEVRGDITAAGRSNFSFLTEGTFGRVGWTERLDVFESPGGQRVPLIFVEVSGGDNALGTITIRRSGAPLEDLLLTRLTRAYRASGWKYEILGAPGGDASSNQAR
jgi:hypothetical protein